MPSFFNFFLKHNDFTVSLSLLKCRIEQYIFDQETYYNILRRRLYYSNYVELLPEVIQNDNAIVITPPTRPKEGCSNYLYRNLISKEPHPYLTNYFNVNIVRSVNIFFNKIRSRYGYSTRPVNMSSSMKLKSQYSDRSIRRQSKQIETPTTPHVKRTKFLSPLSVISPMSASFTAAQTTDKAIDNDSSNNNNNVSVETESEKKKKERQQRHSDSFIRLSNNANTQEPSTNTYKKSRALIYLIPSPSSRFNNVGSPKKKTLNKVYSNSCFGEEDDD